MISAELISKVKETRMLGSRNARGNEPFEAVRCYEEILTLVELDLSKEKLELPITCEESPYLKESLLVALYNLGYIYSNSFTPPNYKQANKYFQYGAALGDMGCAREASFFNLYCVGQNALELSDEHYQQAAKWAVQSLIAEPEQQLFIYDEEHLYAIMECYQNNVVANVKEQEVISTMKFFVRRSETMESNRFFKLLEISRTLPYYLELELPDLPSFTFHIEVIKKFAIMPHLRSVASNWMLSVEDAKALLKTLKLNPSIGKFITNYEEDVPVGLKEEIIKQLEINNAFQNGTILFRSGKIQLINELRKEEGLSAFPIPESAFPKFSLQNMIIYGLTTNRKYKLMLNDEARAVLPESLTNQVEARPRVILTGLTS